LMLEVGDCRLWDVDVLLLMVLVMLMGNPVNAHTHTCTHT
jgi:hypothetical protein